MSLLFNCQSLTKAFGSKSLFRDLSLSLFEGDRIGLIGPNGAGKSTLMKILAGIEVADGGVVAPRKGLRIGYVPQESLFLDLPPVEILVQKLEHEKELPHYEKVRLAETWLSKMGFKGDEPSAARLSGGWKKRLAIAGELLIKPDLLLLDEPTNHLDLEGVLWLEKFLLREVSTFIIISHDRYFLQVMTSRIIEIDRIYPEGLLSIEGSFDHFLEKKELFITGQIEQERSVAGKARRELDWLRQSPKARTTKSSARIQQAEELFQEHKDLRSRNTEKKADIQFEASERQTQKLLVAKNIKIEMGERTLFRNLDITLSPGTRLGLMGPNGCGKTTLLKMIAGEIQPSQGTIKQAENLKIVYFDQHRAKLPLHLTLREVLSPNGDYVTFRGSPVHINGWCKRFLFEPEALGTLISTLSGGERARIAIAHLMLQPADILLLDEPTNDLDIPTLQTLEDNLKEFPGAVVLITHDRCMLENICNLFLALGDSDNNAFYAEFAQWESAKALQQKQAAPPKAKITPETVAAPPAAPKGASSNKKEIDKTEKKIAKIETEIGALSSTLEAVTALQDPAALHRLCAKIAVLESEVDALYALWSALHE